MPGIGPKKAEALTQLVEGQVKLIQEQIAASKLKQESAEEKAEEETPETIEQDEPVSKSIEGESDEPVTEEVEEENPEEEEIPVQELVGVTPEVLQTLINNGFETLAELSVTPLEELLAIEGVDEETGRSILEQVKQRLENLENV